MSEEKNKVGRPRKVQSPTVMIESYLEYIDKCASHTVGTLNNKGTLTNVPKPIVPTVEGFAHSLGMMATSLWEYEEYPEFSDTLKSIKADITARKKIALLNGEGNTTGLIFDLKCNEGWRDKQVIEHEGEITVTMNLS
jgi:hypothetical protein